VVSSHSIGSGLRVIARASTSSMRETGTISSPLLMLSAISTRSLAFSSGMSTVLMPVASENAIQIDSRSAAESEHHRRMIALGLLFLRLLCDRFKPRQQLEAEILVLRHQVNILQQRAPGRPHFRWVDRALFIWLYRRC